MILDQLRLPIVLAPLAGGPSTPRLVAEVSEADAFGLLAAGYLTPEHLAEQLAELRSLTARPFGVNVFSRPPGVAADPGDLRRVRGRDPAAWPPPATCPSASPGSTTITSSGKLDLLTDDPVAVAVVLVHVRHARAEAVQAGSMAPAPRCG